MRSGREVFDMVDADVFQGFVQSKEYAKMVRASGDECVCVSWVERVEL